MSDNAIYTILVMEKLESDHLGWPVFGSTRVVGYYSSKEDAIECVKGNYGDIWETCYNYAVVEKIEEGIYNATREREFFKYNEESDCYEPYIEPLFMEHIIGLTMG